MRALQQGDRVVHRNHPERLHGTVHRIEAHVQWDNVPQVMPHLIANLAHDGDVEECQEIAALRAEVERMRPVVESAVRWYAASTGHDDKEYVDLEEAVEAYRRVTGR